MAINTILQDRSNNLCELCGSEDNNLQAYAVPPKEDDAAENVVVLCTKCYSSVTTNNYDDTEHWRCLTGSIWNETPSVQALSYKLLHKLSAAEWAAETLESVAPDEAVIAWAETETRLAASEVNHVDAHGALLLNGDTIILTQNLNVKGTSFTAPKGTLVRKIRVVPGNAEQIEGKINNEMIVILTKYVRKQA